MKTMIVCALVSILGFSHVAETSEIKGLRYEIGDIYAVNMTLDVVSKMGGENTYDEWRIQFNLVFEKGTTNMILLAKAHAPKIIGFRNGKEINGKIKREFSDYFKAFEINIPVDAEGRLMMTGQHAEKGDGYRSAIRDCLTSALPPPRVQVGESWRLRNEGNTMLNKKQQQISTGIRPDVGLYAQDIQLRHIEPGRAEDSDKPVVKLTYSAINLIDSYAQATYWLKEEERLFHSSLVRVANVGDVRGVERYNVRYTRPSKPSLQKEPQP